MIEALVKISPLFFLVAIGRLLVLLKVADTSWTKVLNTYALKLGFPILIFWALYKSEQSVLEFQSELIYNSLFICFLFFVGVVFLPNSRNKTTYIIGVLFSNIAFLGIPIMTRLYGDVYTAKTSVIASLYLFWMFTLVVFYLEKKNHSQVNIVDLVLKLFKNPLLLGVMLGVAFQLFDWKLPYVVEESVEMLSGSVTSLVLISLGVFTATIQKSDWLDYKAMLVFSFVSLIIAPLVLFIFSKVIEVDLDLSVMEAAMPLAVTPFAMAGDYNLNEKLIAKTIIVSTVFSVITLPLWYSVLQ